MPGIANRGHCARARHGTGHSRREAAVDLRAVRAVDSGLKRGTGGTGLGLAISREIARGMGGDITASNDEVRGAVFSLVLPRS